MATLPSNRSFTEDLTVLVKAYLPYIEQITPVEALVLSQNALFLEMKEAMQFNQKKEEGHDLG